MSHYYTDTDLYLAKKVEEYYNVPVSVTLAQYGLESGWGRNTIGKNNYFNIKGEGTNGYKDYESKEHAFYDFGRLLSTERYTKETADASTVEQYITGVKNAGYAEDEEYVTKVMDIIDSQDLTRFDSWTGSKSSRVSAGNSKGLTWWGDIVKVAFAVLLLVGAVVFLGMAVTGGENPINEIKKSVVKAVA